MRTRIPSNGGVQGLSHCLLNLRKEDGVAIADEVHARDVMPRLVGRRAGKDGSSSMGEASAPLVLLGGREIRESS